MLRRAPQFLFIMLLIGYLLFYSLSPFANAQSQYPKTSSVLETVYIGEVEALHTYLAYARKANAENYPSIANLFVALSTSESIHARNFKDILSTLGAQIEDKAKQEIKVSSTKKNLKKATEVELNEIDKKYPKFIQMIKPENHDEAIRKITYAWESERQHRDLILKIQSGTGIFFGMLAKKIESTPSDYYVCQKCRSTLTEWPKVYCPICKGSVSNYKKIRKIN